MAISKIPYNGDTSWTALNSYVSVKKMGNIVTVIGKCAGNVTLTKDIWNGVGSLPTGYRPSQEIPFVGMNRQNTPYAMMGKITTEGSIEMMPEMTNTSYWLFEVSFPL